MVLTGPMGITFKHNSHSTVEDRLRLKQREKAKKQKQVQTELYTHTQKK
jgi:hypothetical protein